MIRTPRLQSLLAIGSVAAVVGSVACGSAPEGESASSSQQAFAIGPIEPLPACQYEYARVCAPNADGFYFGVCPCQPEIQTETYPGAPAPYAFLACTLSAPIPVLPALAGEGCTLGVNATQDGSTFPVWACPAGTPAPPSVPIPGGGAYVYEVVGAANYAENELDYCVGAPFSGWELIVEMQTAIGSCPSGCPGGGPLHPADEGHH
jgi:hypothetical protein